MSAVTLPAVEATHARCGGTWRIPKGGGPTTCDGCGMELHCQAPRGADLPRLGDAGPEAVIPLGGAR